ncbi:MAG: ORF6N domain-containing protein, partial [Desulfovibrionaceae bacterium]|nr:ORF6N domain-containing protein [Desulfovibrionaceae bacterium]
MSEARAPVTVSTTAAQVGDIAARIFDIRGARVMLSPDLARLYGVETKVLMQAVRRNIDRFPPDFAFMLS